MLLDLVLFLPLAVLTNTAFPMPFDHVLIWFTQDYALREACVFAGVGAVCAAAAGLIDVRLLGALGERLPSVRKRTRWNLDRLWFYTCVFFCAFLPLPYIGIRLALLRGRPNPCIYALVVGLGRMPRYVLMLHLWQSLRLPGWAAGALLLSALLVAAWRCRPSRSPDAAPTGIPSCGASA